MITITRAYLTDINGNAVGTCERPDNGWLSIEITRDVVGPLRAHFDTDGQQDAYSCMIAAEAPKMYDTIRYRVDDVCQAITRGSTSLRAPPARSTDLRRRGSSR